ncbi:MAG: NnrS family protein [Mesorhizobium sp.]|nr:MULTISPECIES: NnrS family protein [unclassified Mesorhizobium]RUV73233.1 NnrS family protein [Mesorhizobium sp. M5C.F.Cr.IN.023.01.1.1]RWF86656.1 MAG: NnrS family protein [Mesorhizobium sp.]RWF95383.1 MAG: NnrS family protein [Mesorhizobium sp.]RWI39779.1 MAG: NnrS family protein [Mesorhizobium sp.]RWI45400.1 MAG: NnrS family protein [Mesorhizobium sp.]
MSTPASAPADRSLLRLARKAGDFSRDGRGRIPSIPPILQYGFRPFFFLAALYAGVAIPTWLWLYFTGRALPGPFHGLHWHAHEMLFGYLGAVIAGFILTAIPNWTGRLPLSGRPLAMLVALWLAGRLACAFLSEPFAAAAIDLAFPAVLAFAVWREVAAGRNWKNAPVAVMITLFGLANAADHAANLDLLLHDLGHRLALAVTTVLIALIGGRIVPSFTRNWLVKEGRTELPAKFGLLDKAALAFTGIAAAAWIAIPDAPATGVLQLSAGILLALRLMRWRGLQTVSEPILTVLHLGYGWLAAAVLLLGLSMLLSSIPQSAALHALTAGAIGTMTLAVMTRASLGHTGREIVADRTITCIYVAVTAGAALRVAAPFADSWYGHVLACGGALWSSAFLLFAVRYAGILFGARVTS